MRACALHLAVFASCLLAVTGCATIVQRSVEEIPITSDPPGATVQVGDQTLTTPATVTLKRNEDYTVRVSKEGYYDNVAILRHRESGWIAGNLLWDLPTTGLLMCLTQGMSGAVIFGPGSMCDRWTGAGYTLVPDKVELVLEKRPPEDQPTLSASRLQPHILQEIAVPAGIGSLHAGAGSLWVVHGNGKFFTTTQALSRIDPRTNQIAETFEIPLGSKPIAVEGNSVWLSCNALIAAHSELWKLDTNSKQIVAKVPRPGPFSGVAVGEGAIWILVVHQEKHGLALVNSGLEVLKIDPQTGEVGARIPLDQSLWGLTTVAGTHSADIAIGSGGVWVVNAPSEKVVRIDPQTLQVTAVIPVNQQIQNVAADDAAVWVFGRALAPKADPPAQVSRIDGFSARVGRPVFVGDATVRHGPATHAAGLGAVWMCNSELGTLEWVDAATGQLAKNPLPLGDDFKPTGYPPVQVIVAEGSVWVAHGSRLLRIGPQ
jgi:streptogramin lyase